MHVQFDWFEAMQLSQQSETEYIHDFREIPHAFTIIWRILSLPVWKET